MNFLEDMNGQELFDALLEGNLAADCKQEIVEWLWATKMLDDEQYTMATSRILHLEKKK
mgnify:CR=1 FL=1